MSYEESLRSLGLEEYIETFHDNNIDDESILLLGEAELKDLIPKIGPRMKLKKFLEELKLKEQQDLTLTADTFVSNKSRSETSVSQDTFVSNKSGSETSVDELNDDINIPINHTAAEEYQTTVKNILSKTLDGRALLNEGQVSGGLLKEGSRRKLSQTVINHIIEKKPDRKISSEEFYKLASEIVTLFPKESQVVYYSAYRAGKDDVAKKNASGKLYESYITRRRKLRQSGELAGTARRTSSSSSRSTSVTSENSDNNESDDYDEKLTFLKNNVEPWGKIEESWTSTSTRRLKYLYKENNGGINLKYPALKQPQGYTLDGGLGQWFQFSEHRPLHPVYDLCSSINKVMDVPQLMNDFNQLYPEKENSLFSAIEIHKQNIIDYAKRKAEYTRDRRLKTEIQSLIALIDEDDQESINNVCLVLLSYIINISPARKRKGKEIIKFSRSEMTSAFICQVSSEADVTPSILERREILASQQRSMQPYVIYVGENCTKIRASYVVINDTIYNFTKLITAVDCAFKIFHSTGACYPEECEDVWLFIQLGFFKIQTKYDRNTQVVNSLMTDLGLI